MKLKICENFVFDMKKTDDQIVKFLVTILPIFDNTIVLIYEQKHLSRVKTLKLNIAIFFRITQLM